MTGRRLTAVTGDEPGEPWEDPAVANDFQSRARQEGVEYDALALDYLVSAGVQVRQGRHHRHTFPVDAEVETVDGRRFLILAHGNLATSSAKPGLRRADTVCKVCWRTVGLAHHRGEPPVIIVTSHLPVQGSVCADQLEELHDMVGDALADIVATTGDLAGYQRLRARFGRGPAPSWRPAWIPDTQLTLFEPDVRADSDTPSGANVPGRVGA